MATHTPTHKPRGVNPLVVSASKFDPPLHKVSIIFISLFLTAICKQFHPARSVIFMSILVVDNIFSTKWDCFFVDKLVKEGLGGKGREIKKKMIKS